MNDSAPTGDFLNHAVRKAFGSDNALAPRLPSLYEPSAESGVGNGIDALPPEGEIGAEQMELSPARAAVRAQAEVPPARTAEVVQDNAQMSALCVHCVRANSHTILGYCTRAPAWETAVCSV